MEENDDESKGEGKRNNILQRALILYIGHVSLEPRGCAVDDDQQDLGTPRATGFCAWRISKPGADRKRRSINRRLPSTS